MFTRSRFSSWVSWQEVRENETGRKTATNDEVQGTLWAESGPTHLPAHTNTQNAVLLLLLCHIRALKHLRMRPQTQPLASPDIRATSATFDLLPHTYKEFYVSNFLFNELAVKVKWLTEQSFKRLSCTSKSPVSLSRITASGWKI